METCLNYFAQNIEVDYVYTVEIWRCKEAIFAHTKLERRRVRSLGSEIRFVISRGIPLIWSITESGRLILLLSFHISLEIS